MFQNLRNRMRALFEPKAMETELAEELRFHFEHQVEKNIKLGMSHEEAVRSARMHFGGMEQVKEDCRDARGGSMFDRTLQDSHFGTRQLRRNHGFALTAISTLALGICSTASIFAFVDAALIEPLPSLSGFSSSLSSSKNLDTNHAQNLCPIAHNSVSIADDGQFL